MRKFFWQVRATLHGYMEGPDRELDDTAQVAAVWRIESAKIGSVARVVRRQPDF